MQVATGELRAIKFGVIFKNSASNRGVHLNHLNPPNLIYNTIVLYDRTGKGDTLHAVVCFIACKIYLGGVFMTFSPLLYL